MNLFHRITVIGILFIASASSLLGNDLNSIVEKKTLSGKVLDKTTGMPLPGVSIYVPDLKTGTASNADGSYSLNNLPATRIILQVSFTGYQSQTQSIDLQTTDHLDFVLEESVAEIHEVVVTGLSQATEKNRNPTPISTIPSIQLLQNTATNIIDALASQPGVSQISTGAGISKPVIRGLGYNRVIVVNDGIRQEGQQWGDEHGIEIDEFGVNHVEILKGPASLAYGSDAMAGVINMLSAPTLPEGSIKGTILSNYQTNNGLIAYSGNIVGTQKGFIWDVRYSDKKAHAYRNAYDGYVFNSGFNEHTLSGILGLNKSWGYSHLHLSSYSSNPGIVEGERDSLSGRFIKPIALNDSTEGSEIVSDKELRSYNLCTPYQQIRHYKAVLNNSFIVGKGSIKAIVGFQQNSRQEYANILQPNQYGLFFLLNTLHYDFRYVFPEKNKFHLSIGLNGMHQQSENKGSEFLIPDYRLLDIGGFFIAKKSYKKLDISGGLRYDNRSQTADALYLNAAGARVTAAISGGSSPFTGFTTSFKGISGSIGASYQFSEQVYTKLNLSRGFRAPNIAELSANGAHEGSINYLIGVPSLHPENSLQLDYALGVNTKHISSEITIFRNYIDHYIFLQKLNDASGKDSLTEGYPTFRYTSGKAVLTGGELSMDLHPHPFDWLHIENTFSYVQSLQQGQADSTQHLPFTPAPSYSLELKVTRKKLGKFFSNAYAKTGINYYFAQRQIYSAFGTERSSTSYTLWNAGIGTDVVKGKRTLLSIYISGTNLSDLAYQSHLSRLQYASLNNATGRTGVYNMGRNISFKVLIPINFQKKA